MLVCVTVRANTSHTTIRQPLLRRRPHGCFSRVCASLRMPPRSKSYRKEGLRGVKPTTPHSEEVGACEQVRHTFPPHYVAWMGGPVCGFTRRYQRNRCCFIFPALDEMLQSRAYFRALDTNLGLMGGTVSLSGTARSQGERMEHPFRSGRGGHGWQRLQNARTTHKST